MDIKIETFWIRYPKLNCEISPKKSAKVKKYSKLIFSENSFFGELQRTCVSEKPRNLSYACIFHEKTTFSLDPGDKRRAGRCDQHPDRGEGPSHQVSGWTPGTGT